MYVCLELFFFKFCGQIKNTNLKFSKQKSTLKTISLVMLSYWFKSWVLKHLTNLKQVSTLTSYQPCFPWTWAFSPTKQCIAVAHAPPSWTQANPAPESNGPRKGCSHRASAAVVRFHFGEGGLRGVDLEPEQALSLAYARTPFRPYGDNFLVWYECICMNSKASAKQNE